MEAVITRLSSEEMTAAIGLKQAPPALRRLLDFLFSLPSRPLARVLSRFDARVAPLGIDRAARLALAELGARLSVLPPAFEVPKRGPLLVVSNHPGAYDALALMAAAGRRDLMILAADRRFLRALPAMAPHLIFFPLEGEDAQGHEGALARVAAMRKAIRHLRSGGAVLHFPAGCIEPDPAFLKDGDEILSPWKPGVGALSRAALGAKGKLLVAMVSGVHSARAKRLWISRAAEKRGVTTLAPLLQVALPGFSDVDVRVRFSALKDAAELTTRAVGDEAIAMELRVAARAMATSSDAQPDDSDRLR